MTNEEFKEMVIAILNVGWYQKDTIVDTQPLKNKLSDEKFLQVMKTKAERIARRCNISEHDAVINILHYSDLLVYGRI